jgi:stage IV sporulation protein B
MLNNKGRALLLLVLLIYIFTSFGTVMASAESGASYDCLECGVTYKSRIWELLFGSDNNSLKGNKEKSQSKELQVYVGGEVFGAKVGQRHLSVVEADGAYGIHTRDKIIALNGIRISDVESMKRLLKANGNKTVRLTVLREGEELDVDMTPKLIDGEYTLGITLRDKAAGIGTVTFVSNDGEAFGGLGHGICDSETGEVIEISGGEVTGVILSGVEKGTAGKPGELCGILTPTVKGSIISNTQCGVFGRMDSYSRDADSLISIGCKNQVHRGDAKIVSTIKNGKKCEYSVEIFDIDRTSTATKSFKIRVTDPTLIALTGGIVRGMSGSPIIQNGKLVGAVTHVMVADPTEGYGIFIENMLNTANEQMQPKAA